MDEPLPEGPRVVSRVAVDASVAARRAPYVKSGAAVAEAVASGRVTVGHLHRAIEILEGAQARNVSPDEALAELEEQVPSLGDSVKELAGKSVTWDVLNFVTNLIRLYFEMTQ